MRLHAEIFRKVSISAGALFEVAAFWANNTKVALGELLKTRVTITLTVAFLTGAAALNTFDGAQVFQRDVLAYIFV